MRNEAKTLQIYLHCTALRAASPAYFRNTLNRNSFVLFTFISAYPTHHDSNHVGPTMNITTLLLYIEIIPAYGKSHPD